MFMLVCAFILVFVRAGVFAVVPAALDYAM